MKCSIVIIGICFAGAVCIGQEWYEDDIAHFAFEVPDGWAYVYEDELGEDNKALLQETYGGRTMVMLVQSGAEPFVTPYILVTIEGVKKPPPKSFIEDQVAGDWRQYVLGEGKSWLVVEQQIIDLQEAKGCLPQDWAGAECVDSKVSHYPERHMIRETVELNKEGVGRIFCYTIKIQGSYRITSLNCYWDGETKDISNFMGAMQTLERTFEYDEGYGYDGQEGEGDFAVAGEKKTVDAGALEAKLARMFVWAMLYAVCLWIGVKYMEDAGGSFATLVFIAFVSALLGQVRFLYLGYPLSIISMYVLIWKLLDVELLDTVFIVVIANTVTIGVGTLVITIILDNFFPGVTI